MKKIFFILLIILNTIFASFIIYNVVNIVNINATKFNKYYYIAYVYGDEIIDTETNNGYDEQDAVEIINDKKIELKTDDVVNIEKKGTYLVKYKTKNKLYDLYRVVNVKDMVAPKIKLKGSSTININSGSKYKEPGYTVTDNYDKDIKVEVIGKVDNKKKGTYKLEYKATDSSGNTSSVTRTVNVKTKLKNNNTVTKTISNEKGKDKKEEVDLKSNPNTTISMSFTNDGMYIKGYIKNGSKKYSTELCDESSCKKYSMAVKDNYYSGNMSLSGLKNGIYKLYVNDNTDKMLVINKLDTMSRINRAKIGNKLVTLSYENNNPKIKIEDFKYEYDILLDAGHGGSDTGATRGKILEKTINLMQTLYEKERYEQHGLKVKLTRDDDTYGLMMGPVDNSNVRRRSYAVGYYGVVSKYVYSNHHNSTFNKEYSGWEVLLVNQSTMSQNDVSYKIVKEWEKNYPTNENHLRIYGRNYNTDALLDKTNGQTYNIKNYYAMQRIPYELFKVITVTYEGCYISNVSDYNWYMDNWKKLSEIKIKAYVEKLGKKYIPA